MKFVVMVSRPLPHETIVSSQEIGEVAVVVVVDQQAAVATEATMVVHMEDRMEDHHLVRTGGATDGLLSGCIVLSCVNCVSDLSSLT